MTMRRVCGVIVVCVAAAFAGCQSTQEGAPEGKAPLFDNLGSHHRTITTTSPDAQRYFDQGLTLTYSFNHDEAIRSYTEATKLDPNCAMAWWGIALCNGPHINNAVMDEPHSKAAWDALQNAKSRKANGTPTEQALIDALGSRYADPAAGKLPLTPEERAPLDRAYAQAMKGVRGSFANDTDVGSLYAESLMDLRPWDFWTKEGKPQEGTEELLVVLEDVLVKAPDHPGANHLYIHAVEASPRAAKAIPSADRLRTLVPGAGHMVHMPAHIDVRVGRWDKAAVQNQEAIKVDRAYRAISPRQGFYNIYMAHNHQFLSWACMMEGRSKESIAAARDMIKGVPPEFIRDMGPAIDGYLHIEIEALLRFGQWDEMLAMKAPPSNLPIYTAMWRYGRATALAAKGQMDAAQSEREEFEKAVKAVPEDAKMAINPAHKVLQIAHHSLAGELAFRYGDLDLAAKHLAEAVTIEDDLLYMEPPDWLWPARHQLGAVLIAAGKFADAEVVYEADLKKWPENGWALYGLATCLEARKSPEAAAVRARFDKAWARADIKLEATCLCVKQAK
jgi:tetratricopeptide (TPR) repeat protein